MNKVHGVLVLAFFLTGCATITRGTTQTVAINTPGVPGASCTLSSASVGSQTITTPASVTLSKSSSAVSIRCTKACYNDGAGILATTMDGMAAGNLIAGGPVGLGVDAATGAMNQYAPQADIVMTPDGSCASTNAPKKKR